MALSSQDALQVNLCEQALTSGQNAVGQNANQFGANTAGNLAIAQKSYSYAYSTAQNITDSDAQAAELAKCDALQQAIAALNANPAATAALVATTKATNQAVIDEVPFDSVKATFAEVWNDTSGSVLSGAGDVVNAGETAAGNAAASVKTAIADGLGAAGDQITKVAGSYTTMFYVGAGTVGALAAAAIAVKLL